MCKQPFATSAPSLCAVCQQSCRVLRRILLIMRSTSYNIIICDTVEKHMGLLSVVGSLKITFYLASIVIFKIVSSFELTHSTFSATADEKKISRRFSIPIFSLINFSFIL